MFSMSGYFIISKIPFKLQKNKQTKNKKTKTKQNSYHCEFSKWRPKSDRKKTFLVHIRQLVVFLSPKCILLMLRQKIHPETKIKGCNI